MTVLRRALPLLLLAMLGGATPSAAQQSPLDILRTLVTPPARPPTNTFRVPGATAAAPVELPVQAPVAVPLPRFRPAHAPSPLAGGAIANGGTAVATAAPQVLRPPPAAMSTCGKALALMGVTAVPIDPIAEGRCGIAAPMAVSAMGGGDVTMTETALIGCETAETLERWLDEHARPAARAILGGDITSLRVAASYACRNRNSQANTRLSEHAKGNAIDISAFQVAGHGWVVVGQETGKRQELLAELRRSACGPFKTVLGPGSDPFHHDHFHFDIAHRRNGSTWCK